MENKSIEELNSKECNYFELRLPIEISGIFRQGWKANELAAVTVICKYQAEVENGALAVVGIKGQNEALLKRIYKKENSLILEAPKNLDNPDEHIPPLVFTLEEAHTNLLILGKVVKFVFTLKNSSEADT